MREEKGNARHTVPSLFSFIASLGPPGAVRCMNERTPPASGLGCRSPRDRFAEAAPCFCFADVLRQLYWDKVGGFYSSCPQIKPAPLEKVSAELSENRGSYWKCHGSLAPFFMFSLNVQMKHSK